MGTAFSPRVVADICLSTAAARLMARRGPRRSHAWGGSPAARERPATHALISPLPDPLKRRYRGLRGEARSAWNARIPISGLAWSSGMRVSGNLTPPTLGHSRWLSAIEASATALKATARNSKTRPPTTRRAVQPHRSPIQVRHNHPHAKNSLTTHTISVILSTFAAAWWRQAFRVQGTGGAYVGHQSSTRSWRTRSALGDRRDRRWGRDTGHSTAEFPDELSSWATDGAC